MKRNRLIALLIAAVVIIAIAVVVVTQLIIPGSTQSNTAGTQPKAPTIALPFNDNSAMQAVIYVKPVVQANPAGTATALYTSCTVLRGSTPTPTGAASGVATAAATEIANASAANVTAVPTEAATAVAADYTVYQISGSESEACYVVGESLPGRGEPFNLAVGVTKAIDGQIAIDTKNLAASKVGQIVIDISQFQSDQQMRDGTIRRRFLESNTYPLAKFTPTQIVGLDARAYVSGETLTFQITGTMNVHNTDHLETLDVTAHLVDANTLVATATTDILMTDFNIQPPTIAGFVTANNQAHLIFNLVAHPVKQ